MTKNLKCLTCGRSRKRSHEKLQQLQARLMVANTCRTRHEDAHLMQQGLVGPAGGPTKLRLGRQQVQARKDKAVREQAQRVADLGIDLSLSDVGKDVVLPSAEQKQKNWIKRFFGWSHG